MMSKVILDLGFYSVYGVNLIMRFQINMRQCQHFDKIYFGKIYFGKIHFGKIL